MARLCGEMPSSNPMIKTTGNSSPLAAWSVISGDGAGLGRFQAVGRLHQRRLFQERPQRRLAVHVVVVFQLGD